MYVLLRAHVNDRRLGEVFLSPVDCIMSDEPAWLDGRVGRSALEAVYAAYRSAGIGATVRLPFRVPQGTKRPIDLWIGAGAS